MLPLIDGDVLCYLACKNRNINEKGYIEYGVVKTFSQAEDVKYMEESWNNFKRLVESITDRYYAKHYLMAVKSDYNYRDDIYPMVIGSKPPIGYKANRWKAPEDRNMFVPEIRLRALESEMAIEAYGREADDLIQMWACQAEAANEKFVVVTNDKDQKVIGGLMFDPKTNTETKVSKQEGLRFFYEQLLMGDPTDNIPGIYGIGPDKAKKALLDCTDEEEFRFVVMGKYMDKFEDDWRNYLLSNGKLLYLQKHEHDYFTLEGWPDL